MSCKKRIATDRLAVPALILASGSPRRRDLLNEAGYAFEVLPSDAEEIHDASLSPPELTETKMQPSYVETFLQGMAKIDELAQASAAVSKTAPARRR